MNNEAGKIKNFTDLNAWKYSHSLVLEIYEITKIFPKEEQFGLTNQIRRAVVSISSNIAEGFSRTSYKDKSHFYSMALGSLTEVQNQLMIARDLGYFSVEKFNELIKVSITVSKLLNGLLKKSKTMIRDS